jgi:hypothetical protein
MQPWWRVFSPGGEYALCSPGGEYAALVESTLYSPDSEFAALLESTAVVAALLGSIVEKSALMGV